ncbi:MAG TPA: serine hydroxymethyltransferase [Myxococcota bacterium]|nr:serine hydroxymethyltransferase [Myxococcota bacterium]HQK50206.1 serine hydroxymethyltransferase [Myxococcota bacterium]
MRDPHLVESDPEVATLVAQEERRQGRQVRLIASENYVSRAVLEATGSVFTNKYSEGYPGKRYYEGQDFVDPLENLAIARARALFGADHANVQPYSGSPANLAVYFATLRPGDTVMGMALPSGGHLTHGWKVSITGSFFRSVQYDVDPQTGWLDLDAVRALALAERPRLLIAGATAYPRVVDFAAFRSIADEVGATLLVDMAHIAGLVAGGAHPSPVPHADVVSTTTHKTLRGPRGAMLLCREAMAKEIDKAVFPGLQGGPHNHTTAGIAVALREASTPAFREYAHQVVRNARRLAAALQDQGFRLITGGTDNHLILVDVTTRGLAGKAFARALSRAGIECNANSIPNDPRKPFDPSGIRLGTAAVTTRGMGEAEMDRIAGWIEAVARQWESPEALDRIASEIAEFCRAFPAPGLPVDDGAPGPEPTVQD